MVNFFQNTAPQASKRPRLTVVGAGPGDPELMTIKGLKALETADVVLYDALANESLLDYAPAHALKIFVGKRRQFKAFSQTDINTMIVEKARQYGHVVRLKGGDPFVLGRGAEEIEVAQAQGLETAYVAGISSAIAVPGQVGIPVTYRNLSRSFWVMTATTETGELAQDVTLAAQTNATVLILMGTAKLTEIVGHYKAAGRADCPIAIIQNGTLPTEKVVTGTIENIENEAIKAQVGAPAVIVIGAVVALHGSKKALVQWTHSAL